MKIPWPVETHEPSTVWAPFASVTDHRWITPNSAWLDEMFDPYNNKKPSAVPSNGTIHYILATDGGTIACTCKGFQYRNTCRHSDALQGRTMLDKKPIPRAWSELVAELY
mgnify:CR=1 FL=1